MAEKVDIFFLVFDFEETRKITKNSNTQRHIFAMPFFFLIECAELRKWLVTRLYEHNKESSIKMYRKLVVRQEQMVLN